MSAALQLKQLVMFVSSYKISKQDPSKLVNLMLKED